MRLERMTNVVLGCGLCLSMTMIAPAGDPGYEMARSTTGSGGTLVGGGFELRGAVEKGTHTGMTGGGFALHSGFNVPVAPTDCDEDGGVTLLDYGVFEFCLSGPDLSFEPGCECYDVNRDGAIDLVDFAQAQAAFSGP